MAEAFNDAEIAAGLDQLNEGFAIFDFHGDLSLSLARRLLALPLARERLLILDPSDQTLYEYGQFVQKRVELQHKLKDIVDAPAVTLESLAH